ncbi:TAZ zinc finger family protein [Aphelenchoides avenae]|nr:TAZ zinc finger family protein [Aphelenchus avenae]
MSIPNTITTTVKYVLARCDGEENQLYQHTVKVPNKTTVENLVKNHLQPVIGRVMDAARTRCNVAGIVLTDESVGPLFLEYWLTECVEEGSKFDVILLEDGFSSILRDTSSLLLTMFCMWKVPQNPTAETAGQGHKRFSEVDEKSCGHKQPRFESHAESVSSAASASAETVVNSDGLSQRTEHRRPGDPPSSSDSAMDDATAEQTASQVAGLAQKGDPELPEAVLDAGHADDDVGPFHPEAQSDEETDEDDDGFQYVTQEQQLEQGPNTTDSLQKRLRDILDALWYDESSVPFRTPRKDGKAQGCYGLTEPICLEDIKKKLADGVYEDLSKFRDDMDRLFNNARLFYHFKSHQYKYSITLHGVYARLATPLFTQQGFCCAEKDYLHPARITCSLCGLLVKWGDYFYTPRVGYAKMLMHVCHRCFVREHGAAIVHDGVTIEKKGFDRSCHNQEYKEPLVVCSTCDREFHAVCVGLMNVNPNVDFFCKNCGGIPTDPTTRAEGIPHTALSRYIEEKIEDVLGNEAQVTGGQKSTPGRVLIRVASSKRSSIQRHAAVAEKYGQRQFPYTYRTIYAFQETSDGQQICFFALHAHEYGSDCPTPNRGHVYLAFLDSVKFFHPMHLRTEIYYQILLSYMEWVRDQGFARLCLFPYSPTKGESYLFPSRAAGHQIMTQKLLLRWYITLFEEGIQQGIVHHQTNSLEAYWNTIKTAADVPYFEGDYLASLIDAAAVEEIRTANMKNSKLVVHGVDGVGSRFLMALKNNKTHLVVELMPPAKVKNVLDGVSPIKEDPDPPIACPIVENRQAFFSRCAKAEVPLRFSTPREAKFASKHLCQWINADRGELNAD